MKTKTLLKTFDQIPSESRLPVYRKLLATKLIRGFADGSCGCPLMIAASVVANQEVSVLTAVSYQEPLIAETLGISQHEVRSFNYKWEHTHFLDRMAFKLAILQELAKLLLVVITPMRHPA